MAPHPLGSPAEGRDLITVCWEFSDGAFGSQQCDSDNEADALAREVCEACPSARVWVGDDIVQMGYQAADDRSWMF